MKKKDTLSYLTAMLTGVVLLVCSGCVSGPQPDPTSARELVAKAYASGASRLAAEEYSAASEALKNAEQQIRGGDRALARESLRMARENAQLALQLTDQEKRRRLEEIRREEERRKEVKPVVVKPKLEKVLPPKPAAPTPKPPSEPELVDQVKVREGETLSNIAARKEVYGDPMLWPLVYKANRDQIKDPTQIFPGQILIIPRDKSDEEKEAAREEARSLKLFR